LARHSADTAPPAASAPAPSPQQHLTESQARRPLLLRLLSSAGLQLRVSLPLLLFSAALRLLGLLCPLLRATCRDALQGCHAWAMLPALRRTS
jgi:hypothetical protein